jgi:hypothetical protein
MIKYYILILAVAITGCTVVTTESVEDLRGVYGLSSYFDTIPKNKKYEDYFLIDFREKEMVVFGVVQTWGTKLAYHFNEAKDTILGQRNYKVYRKSGLDNLVFVEAMEDGQKKIYEYKKMDDSLKLIDETGLNIKKLTDLLNASFIAGKYRYNDKTIELTKDGRVINLEGVNYYTVKPRLGTCWWYSDYIIEMRGAIWKYEWVGNKLILSRYSDKRDQMELYTLSDEKIELIKIK